MILLSFDIEEFDMPLEYNGEIPLDEQLAVSRKGLQNILRILNQNQVKATFFSTVIFAQNNQAFHLVTHKFLNLAVIIAFVLATCYPDCWRIHTRQGIKNRIDIGRFRVVDELDVVNRSCRLKTVCRILKGF